MVVVCHPDSSVNLVIGLDAFNPSIETLVPMPLRQVSLPNARTDRFRQKVKIARDAVLLILPHPSLNLLPNLVDGTKRAVELRELVVVTLEIGATKIIPGVVVHHLYVRQIGVTMGKTDTVKEIGTGAGGYHTFNLKGMPYNISDRLFNLT